MEEEKQIQPEEESKQFTTLDKYSQVLQNCQLEEAREVCEGAVEEILQKKLQGDADVFEKLQALCEKVIAEGKGKELCDGICKAASNHVTLKILDGLLNHLEDDKFVKTLNKAWEDFYFRAHEIGRVFEPLQEYCFDAKVENPQARMVRAFRDEVVLSESVLAYAQEHLNKMIERCEGGEVSLRTEIRKSCFMLKTLDYGGEKPEKYRGKFEEGFLERCSEFYESS